MRKLQSIQAAKAAPGPIDGALCGGARSVDITPCIFVAGHCLWITVNKAGNGWQLIDCADSSGTFFAEHVLKR